MAARISGFVMRVTTRTCLPALKQPSTFFAHVSKVQTSSQWFINSLYAPASRQPVALLSTVTPKKKAKT